MLEVSNGEIVRHRVMWENIKDHYDEKSKRLFAAAMAKAFGHGGIKLAHQITRINEKSIQLGINQLNGKEVMVDGRQRRSGAGRKKIVEMQPEIKAELEKLVSSDTKGDPESPLIWTSKSTYKLADELATRGFSVSPSTVQDILKDLGYSLQANMKSFEGLPAPGRDEQFKYINNSVKEFQDKKQPVISIDAKKKENIGDFKNNGKEYRLKGQPEKVRVYDFLDKKLGKVTPYGVLDLARNEALVSVGITHDTAEFAVESIRRWWRTMGSSAYPDATKLLITADVGGSNGSRTRLWKTEMQKLSNETGLSITVSHFPPGTSKWNKIEHQLFSFISINWRGKPLRSLETVVNLIANTTTKSGLIIKSMIDTNSYEKGKKITDKEMGTLKIHKHEFHGEWNYTISPQ